jgi:hypothetical protein
MYAGTMLIDEIPAGMASRTHGYESNCRHHKIRNKGSRTEAVAKQQPVENQDRHNTEREVSQRFVGLDEGFRHTGLLRRPFSLASRNRSDDATQES